MFSLCSMASKVAMLAAVRARAMLTVQPVQTPARAQEAHPAARPAATPVRLAIGREVTVIAAEHGTTRAATTGGLLRSKRPIGGSKRSVAKPHNVATRPAN